jgi:phenylalanyl-tRNA synthetase beta chain
MGGFDSMITEKTRNVLIESAWFDPASIRRTARRHAMHTDASHRFERGADIGITPTACARVAQLILETSGGELEGAAIDAYPRKLSRPALRLRRAEVERVLGLDIPERDVSRILRRLGFAVTASPSSSVTMLDPVAPATRGGTHAAVAEEVADLTVEVPTWRLDVEREIDLIEEIARIYGFDRFPNTLPAFSGSVVERPDAEKDAKIRESLLALGYNEAISLTFISHTDASAFGAATPVDIANPLSEEASVMRTSMLPGMIGMVGYNLNRGNGDVRLFETGNIYENAGTGTAELRRVCMGASGASISASVHGQGRAYTFFDMKGDLETLLGAFECRSLYFDPHTDEYYHPGRAARAVMDGTTVARFGQLHPRIAAERKLRQDVYLAEIDLERLYRHALRRARYEPIPRFPAVERDFSFIFDDGVTFERIQTVLRALQIPEMRSLVPVEVFRGGGVATGKYSLLLRATFQAADRTLRDDEVALWSSQIIKALEAIGGKLRA